MNALDLTVGPDVEGLRVEVYSAPDEGLEPQVMVASVEAVGDLAVVTDVAALTPVQARKLALLLVQAADTIDGRWQPGR